MPVFKDADELYTLLGGLFEALATDADVGPRLQGVDTVLQLRMRRPDSLVTIKVLAEEEPVVEMGITELRPEVTMLMEADTAHGLWLGQVNPGDALARGRIRAQGPVVKILAVIPLIDVVRERYAARLADAGREDLAGDVPRHAAADDRDEAPVEPEAAPAEPEVAAEPEAAAETSAEPDAAEAPAETSR